MKKRVRKLELHRETLQRLSGFAVWGAAPPGGDGVHYISEVYSACPLDCGTDTGPILTVMISVCINGQPLTCDGDCFP